MPPPRSAAECARAASRRRVLPAGSGAPVCHPQSELKSHSHSAHEHDAVIRHTCSGTNAGQNCMMRYKRRVQLQDTAPKLQGNVDDRAELARPRIAHVLAVANLVVVEKHEDAMVRLHRAQRRLQSKRVSSKRMHSKRVRSMQVE
eukprot:6190782-Pleurochrysis_carterae.AAC.1